MPDDYGLSWAESMRDRREPPDLFTARPIY